MLIQHLIRAVRDYKDEQDLMATRSPLPPEQTSPAPPPMDGIPESIEDDILETNGHMPINSPTPEYSEQLKQNSYQKLESNEMIKTELLDDQLSCNQQNEFAM